MGNVLRVFWRDVKRLFRTPPALLVAVFLIVLPSLYSWFNVVGFWNPYENTGNLRVCVVNEDTGADDATLGHLDVGAQVVEQLDGDTRLQWAFVDRQQALDEIAAGKAYAAFIIPSHFSSDVATLATGNFQQPVIEYYVNEKVGPVAPKIMDTGANTLDTSINSTFVSTVSSAVAAAVDDSTAAIRAKVEQAGSEAIDHVRQADDALGQVRTSISSLADTASSARDKTGQAQDSLKQARDRTAQVVDAVNNASTLMGQANADAVKVSATLGTALDQGSLAASQATGEAVDALGNLTAAITSAKGDIDAAARQGEAANSEGASAIARLEEVVDALPAGDAKTAVQERIKAVSAANSRTSESLDTVAKLSADASATAASVAASATQVDAATKKALQVAGDYRATLSDGAIPEVSQGLSSLAESGSVLSSSVAAQSALVDQTSAALGQLQSTLTLSADALGQTDSVLAGLQAELSTVETDLQALVSAEGLADLMGNVHVDPVKVAEFMQSPTQVQTEELYPMNAYGSAMAPLFINLTLWIGVFMLMVIMRLEVDEEGIERLTVSQRFFGRWLLLGIMATLQAVVCCAGCLAIGLQATSVPALYITAIVASLSYLAIQYTLSSLFLHVGKGICVILVFVQIPAATGLYPIEMTPAFFQAVYPLFPFTYGINAMREAVFGFYGNQWAFELAVLAGFLLVFMALGALARPYTANLNRLYARQIRESDLINLERIELPERHYRIAQLLFTLLNREEYRVDVERRVLSFMRWYPTLRKATVVLGIVVPAVLTVVFAVTDTDKVVMLTAWLISVVAVLGVLVGAEYARDRLLHQLQLNDLTEEELRNLYTRNGGLDFPTRSTEAPQAALADDGGAR